MLAIFFRPRSSGCSNAAASFPAGSPIRLRRPMIAAVFIASFLASAVQRPAGAAEPKAMGRGRGAAKKTYLGIVKRLEARLEDSGGAPAVPEDVDDLDEDLGLDFDDDDDLDKNDRSKVIGTAIPSGVVIAIIQGIGASYIGVGGGIFTSDLINPAAIIRIYWRHVF